MHMQLPLTRGKSQCEFRKLCTKRNYTGGRSDQCLFKAALKPYSVGWFYDLIG